MVAAESAGLPRDLVFVDLETTGYNAAHHRITEIGIVRVANGALIEEWSSLVNPECRIPSYIESFTGISNEMVAAAPRFADIARLVLEKLRSLLPAPSASPASPASPGPPAPIFVAHNARFDYAFLRAEFRRIDMHFAANVLCTVKLSRRLFPEHPRHSLDALMERHGLKCQARHRALGDARVLKDFWFKLQSVLPEAALAAAVQTVLGAGRLPAHLPNGLAEELPEGPGAYRFFGLDDVLLYVGKSNSLRTRILAHFAADHPDAKEQKLGRQVRRVDWLETAGELGALLCEAQWIKTQQPVYNRRFKPVDSVTVRVACETGEAELLAVADLEAEELAACYGVFHSLRDARKALTGIARAQLLCLKALGLSRSAGSCFAYQFGQCKGACVGKEPLILHAVRVQMALSALKLKAWPFPGRVAIAERDGRGGGDLHVLDHWAYLGTARSDEELAALAAKEAPTAFDAHVYRILVRYMASHPKLDWRDLPHGKHPQGAPAAGTDC